MLSEPVDGEPGDILERAGLLKQMRSSRYDGELALAAHSPLRLAIQLQHGRIRAADDQQHGSDHLSQPRLRQIRATAP
jgi:hypothetical protein